MDGVVGKYEMVAEQSIFADWFSGTLRMSTGHEVFKEQMDFGQYFSSEFFAELQGGIVTRTWNVFRDRQANEIPDPCTTSEY